MVYCILYVVYSILQKRKNSKLAEPKLETIQLRSLGEEAANKIRQAIASGHFKAGQKLVETALARELGLSRSPVREALYLLEQEGLIVRHHRRGAFVRGLSRRETEEIYSLRSVLEGFAVERALKNMTPQDIAHLRQLVAKMYEIAKTGDAVAFGRVDAEFHEYICKVSDHQLLQNVFSTLQTRTTQYMTEADQLGVLENIAGQHETLFQHIVSQDSDEAVRAMQEHILVSAERLLRGYPDYVEEDQQSDEVT